MYICDGLVLNLPPENKPWNVGGKLRRNYADENNLKINIGFRKMFTMQKPEKQKRENWNLSAETWKLESEKQKRESRNLPAEIWKVLRKN